MKGHCQSVQYRLLRVFLKVFLSTSHDASGEVSMFPHQSRNRTTEGTVKEKRWRNC